MSTTEKVKLVETVDDQYDLSKALSVVHMPKSTWYYHQNQKQDYQEKYAHLHPKLEAIAREHPEYGICQLTSESVPDIYTKNIPELHGQSVPGQRSQFQNIKSHHEGSPPPFPAFPGSGHENCCP
jgi:exopolysaccharide biosynthesis predicted pyruvyltransferase EpsI